jgi:hypothetical protein
MQQNRIRLMTLSIIPLWTSGWTVAAAHFALDHLAANLMALLISP